MIKAPNKRIIFDEACPMCRAYTAGFVQLGILAPEGRVGFSQVATSDLCKIDVNRARHEIPLIDTDGGETVYGLQALFTLLGSRFPALQPLFHLPVTTVLLTPLYRYISYNRRVIAGCAAPPLSSNGMDSAPDFSARWRIAHLVVCGIGWLALLTTLAFVHPLFALPISIAALFQSMIAVVATVATRQASTLWNRAGSVATNTLTFALLLRLFTIPIEGNILLFYLAMTIAAAITLLDLRRRLIE